jgi:hypothetical protein
MATAKFKVPLREDVYGILKISLTIPASVKARAELIGIGEQEQNNLINQTLAEITQLLGNDEES